MKAFDDSLTTITVLVALAILRAQSGHEIRLWIARYSLVSSAGHQQAPNNLDIQFQALNMGTVQAPQTLAAPQIRLTNPAAEFIDHLDEDFHPALPNPAVQYDSKADDYRMKEDMKR